MLNIEKQIEYWINSAKSDLDAAELLISRYPDYNPVIPAKEKVTEYLNKTKGLLIWIEKKL